MSFDLRTARINAGLSIKGLARETKVNEHSIRALESGERGVRPENAKKVADYFDVQVTDVMPVDPSEVAA